MLLPTEKAVARDVARVLATVCDPDAIADLMNATISAEAEPALTDYEVDLAEAFFDALTEFRPECVDLATGK